MATSIIKTKNKYGVGKRQWKKWTEDARLLFNDLYATACSNQRIMTHPLTNAIDDIEWTTIAWNHSWLAADYISMRQKGTVKI